MHAGNFCPQSGLTAQVPCTASFYCSQPGLRAVSGPCNAGYFCPVASTSPTQSQCLPGSYCPAQASAPSPCPVGSMCPTAGLSVPMPCTPGFYCDAQSLTNVTGPCPGGYFCPAGSTSSTQNACTPGHYCTSESATPLPCPPGTFNTNSNSSSIQDCEECPRGSFCKPAASVPCLCPVNTFQGFTGASSCTPCEMSNFPQVGSVSCQSDIPSTQWFRSVYSAIGAGFCVLVGLPSICLAFMVSRACLSVKHNFLKSVFFWYAFSYTPYAVFQAMSMASLASASNSRMLLDAQVFLNAGT